MARDHRMATIAIMLASGQRLRAADLAQRFEVSERTVYRDMQRLADQGFPLAAIPGPNGGYALFPTAPARNVTLQLDEAVTLAIGAALASQVACRDDGGAARRALTKIQAALPDTISCALPGLLDLFLGSADNGKPRRAK
jgi:predicted DNA-binding transcriptional regulator YafY